MSWIREIDYEASSGELRDMYDRALKGFNRVPAILKVMSLRPHALKTRMAPRPRFGHELIRAGAGRTLQRRIR